MVHHIKNRKERKCQMVLLRWRVDALLCRLKRDQPGCLRNKASECRNSNLKDVSCYLPSLEKEPLHRGSLESHSCCPPLITLWHSCCGVGGHRIALIYAYGGEAQYLPCSPMDGDLLSSVVLHLLIVQFWSSFMLQQHTKWEMKIGSHVPALYIDGLSYLLRVICPLRSMAC